MNGFQELLTHEFSIRKSRNTHYSIRAFSNYLGLSKTIVSEIISGKRRPSKKTAAKIVDKLKLSPIKSERLLETLQTKNIKEIFTDHLQLKEDQFRMLSVWYYSAIFCLVKITTNIISPSYFAKRLGISKEQVSEAFFAMERLGIIERTKQSIIPRKEPLISHFKNRPKTIYHHQKNLLRLAEKALDEEDGSRTGNVNLIIGIDPEMIPEVQEEVGKLLKKFAKKARAQKATEVYTFAFQLFPLTKEIE